MGDERPTDKEIEDKMYQARDLEAEGENPYWSMTYAQGVEAALAWVLGPEFDGVDPLEE